MTEGDINLPEIAITDDIEIDTLKEPEREETQISQPDTGDKGILVELRAQTELLQQIADREGLN